MAAPGPRPFVSVIVPVYNDPEGVTTTLESLLAQTYPVDALEILVVDNGSSDDTRRTVRRYAEASAHVSLLVEDEIQGSYAARNRGIRAAGGDVLAFLDADVTAPPDYLGRGVETLEERRADYLACDVTLYTRGRPSLLERYNEATGFPVARYVANANFGPTAALFVRASVFEELGSFDERLLSGGDGEFGDRVHRAGLVQAFAPELTVYHPTRSSLGDLLRKRARVGRGTIHRRERYPDRFDAADQTLSVRNVLPPRPGTLRERCRGWESLSRADRVLFYLLTYLLKLATASGLARGALAARGRGD